MASRDLDFEWMPLVSQSCSFFMTTDINFKFCHTVSVTQHLEVSDEKNLRKSSTVVFHLLHSSLVTQTRHKLRLSRNHTDKIMRAKSELSFCYSYDTNGHFNCRLLPGVAATFSSNALA